MTGIYGVNIPLLSGTRLQTRLLEMASTDIEKLRKLTIGVVPGTGRMGSNLARHYALAGLKVVIGSRDAQKAKMLAEEMLVQFSEQESGKTVQIKGCSNQDAAAQADVIFWCIMVSLLSSASCTTAPHDNCMLQYRACTAPRASASALVHKHGAAPGASYATRV